MSKSSNSADNMLPSEASQHKQLTKVINCLCNMHLSKELQVINQKKG